MTAWASKGASRHRRVIIEEHDVVGPGVQGVSDASVVAPGIIAVLGETEHLHLGKASLQLRHRIIRGAGVHNQNLIVRIGHLEA